MANKELGLLTNYLQYDTYTTYRAVLTLLLTDKQTATKERKRNNNSIQFRYNKEKWHNDRNSELRKIRRQYPFFSKEVFPTDYFFSFIFCYNFGSKSMNVRKNLVISAIPQEKLSNYYKIVQQYV